jgi:two-component system OmpR family sensor kinase
MKFKSITTKVTIGFAITIFLLFILFIFGINYEKRLFLKKIANHYDTIAHYIFHNRLDQSQAINYLENMNFKPSENMELFFHLKREFSGRGFEIFKYKEEYYIHLPIPHMSIVAKDTNIYEKTHYAYVGFVVILVFLLINYLWILRSLRPLKELKKEIKKFSNGELDINCKSNKEDEIAEVANEFDNAVKKISLLLNSRQLFLRTIMHELKTPIAKGRIVSELINEEKQKNRMINVFEKLNFMIDDFARIEKIVSKNYQITLNSTSLNILMDKAIDFLMLDSKENIILENIDESKIKVDIELFSMAIKNLIDNAIKHSIDHKVTIKKDDNKILFISKGNKLDRNLDEYFKPFHQDTKSKNHGMGLGLYIIHSILTIHKMELNYHYENENSIFEIKLG